MKKPRFLKPSREFWNSAGNELFGRLLVETWFPHSQNLPDAFLLQARASSFISHRLAQLAVPEPQRTRLAPNMLLPVVFACVLLAGVLGTAAHAACFVARTQTPDSLKSV